MDEQIIGRLRENFDPNVVKKKGVYSFVSHGLVTQRLLKVDPSYETKVVEVFTYNDQQGVLHCSGVTLSMTVHGVTHEEGGGPQRTEGFQNELKNALSDAFKRCAMRFGVALDIWEKLTDSRGDEDYDESYHAEERPVQRPYQPQGGNYGSTAPFQAPRGPQGSSQADDPFPRDEQPQSYQQRPVAPQRSQQDDRPRARPGSPPSEKQLNYLAGLARERGYNDVDVLARERAGAASLESLDKNQVSDLIETLTKEPRQ